MLCNFICPADLLKNLWILFAFLPGSLPLQCFKRKDGIDIQNLRRGDNVLNVAKEVVFGGMPRSRVALFHITFRSHEKYADLPNVLRSVSRILHPLVPDRTRWLYVKNLKQCEFAFQPEEF